MNIRISITKRIMMMVLIPILAICLIVGVSGMFILDIAIKNEIEKQLMVSAYNFKTEYGLVSDEEMDILIKDFKRDTGIDVTIFTGAKRTLSTIEGAVNTDMDGGILNSIDNGVHYYATDANVNGQPYFGYYIPIMDDGKYVGASFTGIPQEEANKTILHSIAQIVGLVLVCGVFAASIAFIRVRKLSTKIKKVDKAVTTLSENDLSVTHEKIPFEHDELESLYNNTADFSDQLAGIIEGINNISANSKSIASVLKETSETASQNSNEIAKAIDDISQGAMSQAEETTNATLRIEDMSDQINDIRANVEDLYSFANSMNEAKNNVFKTLDELRNVNATMSNDIDSTNQQVTITTKSVEQIGEVIKVIENIAKQIQLLALNASIEAARAGEHGKGFAVVAEEVGKLAAQSTSALDNINHIIKDLQNNYAIIVNNVDETTDNMATQNQKLSDTQAVFDILEKDINNTVDRVVSINSMIDSLNANTGKIVDMISNLSAISQQNSAATEETNAGIEEMTASIEQVAQKAREIDDCADELINKISVFKTE